MHDDNHADGQHDSTPTGLARQLWLPSTPSLPAQPPCLQTCSESTADMFMHTASSMTTTPIHLEIWLALFRAPRACRAGRRGGWMVAGWLAGGIWQSKHKHSPRHSCHIATRGWRRWAGSAQLLSDPQPPQPPPEPALQGFYTRDLTVAARKRNSGLWS